MESERAPYWRVVNGSMRIPERMNAAITASRSSMALRALLVIAAFPNPVFMEAA